MVHGTLERANYTKLHTTKMEHNEKNSKRRSKVNNDYNVYKKLSVKCYMVVQIEKKLAATIV